MEEGNKCWTTRKYISFSFLTEFSVFGQDCRRCVRIQSIFIGMLLLLHVAQLHLAVALKCHVCIAFEVSIGVVIVVVIAQSMIMRINAAGIAIFNGAGV